MKYKKGALSFEFIHGLIFLFALAILFIVLNQVLLSHSIPAVENLVPPSFSGKSDIVLQDNDYLSFWNILPYVFVVLIIFYWIISSVKQKQTNT
jgi:hypothetical protein